MHQSLGARLGTAIKDAWSRLFGLDDGDDREPDELPLERPWLRIWDSIPKRSAGPGFSQRDYRDARSRARDVARLTLGDELWAQLQRDGFVEVSSSRYPGVAYRLRPGRRVEVCCTDGVRSPWPYPYLCINPVYPLPDEEFLAHLYLYVRDREDEVIRTAAPQPWDQYLGRTF